MLARYNLLYDVAVVDSSSASTSAAVQAAVGGGLSATQSLQRTVNEITSKLDINDKRVLALLKDIQSGIKELESLQR